MNAVTEDLQRLAQVELTSEGTAYPIETALTPSIGVGWRAAEAGKQTIRLLFDEAQRINRSELSFHQQQHRLPNSSCYAGCLMAVSHTRRSCARNITSVRQPWHSSSKIMRSIPPE
jgi:hypothetical protein